MRKFWMVKGSGEPTFKHESKASAVNEAERLAVLHAPSSFVVLEAIAVCKKSSVAWEELEGDDDYGDNLPF